MTNTPLTKETILDATEQVIRRFGINKAKISDVAKVLQVSHAAIYRYFDNKNALWNAVTQRWLHGISTPLWEIVQTDIPAQEKLKIWLEQLNHSKREMAIRDPEMFSIYTSLAQSSGEILSEHLKIMEMQLGDIIIGGVTEGVFAKQEPKKSAQALLAATNLFHHPSFSSEWNNPEIDDKFEIVFQLLCNGLKYQSG